MKISQTVLKTSLFFSVFIFSVFVKLSAQKLSYYGNAPFTGDSISFQDAPYASPGPSGAGQIWDFSQLIPTGLPTVKEYFIPNNVPNNIYDPIFKSNLAYISPGQIPGSLPQTNYLLSDSSGLYELGRGDRKYRWNLPDTTTPFNAKVLVLKFPFQLGDSVESGSAYYIGNYTTWGEYYSAHTKIVADATGTLLMASGTYTNTLRIHRIFKTSSLNQFASSGSHTVYDDFESYEWYARGYHGAILKIYTETSYSWWVPSTIVKWSSIYNDYHKNPLAIQSYSKNEFTEFSFQNPCKDYLFLFMRDEGFSQYTIKILNLSGEELLSDTFSEKRRSTNLSNLSSGIYILQIINQNGDIARKKLIIEK